MSVHDNLPRRARLSPCMQAATCMHAATPAGRKREEVGWVRQVFPDVTAAPITAVCFDGPQRKFIVGDEAGGLTAYNYLNCAPMRRFDSPGRRVSGLAYCPLARCVLAASWGGLVRVYRDAAGDDEVRVLRQFDGHAHDVTCLAFSVALGLVASACAGGGVRVWDLDEAKLVGSCTAHAAEVPPAPGAGAAALGPGGGGRGGGGWGGGGGGREAYGRRSF